MWKRFGSTKFLLTATCIIVVVLAWTTGRPIGELTAALGTFLGLYLGANVGQSAVYNKYGNNEYGTDDNFSSPDNRRY